MNSILFIDGGNWNGVTSVQVNVLGYFLDRGHDIEIIIFDNGIMPSPLKLARWPRGSKVHYNVIKVNSIFVKILSKITLGRQIVRLALCWSLLRKYRTFYAFDVEAAIICSAFRIFYKSASYFLHSIELYEDTANSFFANFAFRKASKIITQDYVRKQKLIELYNLKEPSKVLESINSSRQSDSMELAPIEFPEHIKNKIKVLFIGSLIDQHCFGDILRVSRTIPENVCLIIHGWGGEKYEQQIKELLLLKPQNIWVSNLQLDDISKYRLYSSIDIGLVTFNDSYFNGKYAGLSAGKLYDFIRVGKPVLVSNILGLREFVERTKVGIVVNDLSQIYLHANEIISQHQVYKDATHGLFEQFEFDVNFDNTYSAFESLIECS